MVEKANNPHHLSNLFDLVWKVGWIANHEFSLDYLTLALYSCEFARGLVVLDFLDGFAQHVCAAVNSAQSIVEQHMNVNRTCHGYCCC